MQQQSAAHKLGDEKREAAAAAVGRDGVVDQYSAASLPPAGTPPPAEGSMPAAASARVGLLVMLFCEFN